MNTDQTLHVLFLHGFTSSARSGKANFLKDQCTCLPHVEFTIFDFNPTPKDFEYLTVTGMINRVRQFLLERAWQQVFIMASSLGGLVATRYAQQFGGVHQMLLLAPALFYHPWGTSQDQIAQWKHMQVAPVDHHGFQREIPLRYTFHEDGLKYTEPVPPVVDTTIIHGRQDQTIPIAYSRDYAATYPDKVHLVEIDADHRLTGHNEFLWKIAYPLLHP